nr:pyrroline-5-carboxylate reductase dimerization domain-containing protein [Sphingomonas jinjuensis]
MIGCGAMGGAMLSRWLEAGLDPARVTIVTRSPREVPEGTRHLTSLPSGEQPAAVVLAMKPQQLGEVAPTLAGVEIGLLVSILAGVDTETLARRIPARAVLRAMPNLPVAIGRGVTGLYTDSDDPAVRATGDALAAPLGVGEWIDDEARFDAVTALAGSGPGFLFRIIDAFAAAGERLGLPADQSLRLAIATVDGAGRMAAAAGASPAMLADRVASKGGSTRKGLDVLDRDGALVALLTDTLAAAERRNAEMAAEARQG